MNWALFWFGLWLVTWGLGGCVKAILEKERVAHAALVEAVSDARWTEFNACLTGDCPHFHANECLAVMQADIMQTSGKLDRALGALD